MVVKFQLLLLVTGWIKYRTLFWYWRQSKFNELKSMPQQMLLEQIQKDLLCKDGSRIQRDIVCVSDACTKEIWKWTRGDQCGGAKWCGYYYNKRAFKRPSNVQGLDFTGAPEENFDDPLGESTGEVVFAQLVVLVMEAASQFAVETLTGEEEGKKGLWRCTRTDGIKEATYKCSGNGYVKVAVASGP